MTMMDPGLENSSTAYSTAASSKVMGKLTSSPTSVENMQEVLTNQRQQQANTKRFLAKSSLDHDKEQRQSILRKNADLETDHNNTPAMEQRRLIHMALGVMGGGDHKPPPPPPAPPSLRERIHTERGLQELQATRQSVMETIRRQREEDRAAAAALEQRRQQLVKKPSNTSMNSLDNNHLNEVASKYSGLSSGLSRGLYDNTKKNKKGSLKSMLGTSSHDRESSKHFLRMSQSLSGLNMNCEDEDNDERSVTGGSMSRSEQRWQTRADFSRLSSSASLLSGGHVQKVDDDSDEEEDDASTTEPDLGSSLESDDEDDEDDPMKDESIRIPTIEEDPMTAPMTPVSATPNQSAKPKGILKRTSTIGSSPSVVATPVCAAATPLASCSQSSHSELKTPARSILSALYDGGKTMSLNQLTVDNSASHASPKQPRRAEPTTPNRRHSRRTKEGSSRKLDSSSRKDGSSRKLDSSRRSKQLEEGKSSSSRKLRDGSSRHNNNESSSNNNPPLSRSSTTDSGTRHRLSSMSRAQSARRLNRGHRKTLEKSNSNSSKLSSNDNGEELTTSATHKKKETKRVESSKSSSSSSKPESMSSKSRHQRTSGGDTSMSNSSSRENSRKESNSGGDRGRKESGDRGGRRARSRSRACGERNERTSHRRQASRSRSRARRTTTKKPSHTSDLAASAQERSTMNSSHEDNNRDNKRTSRRRQKSDRNLTKSRSERNTSSRRSDDVDHSKRSSQQQQQEEEDRDEVPDLLQFNPSNKHNLSSISPRPSPSSHNDKAMTTPSSCDHQDLADNDDATKSGKKKSRKSIMKLPLWGKKKSSSHQPMENSVNGSFH